LPTRGALALECLVGVVAGSAVLARTGIALVPNQVRGDGSQDSRDAFHLLQLSAQDAIEPIPSRGVHCTEDPSLYPLHQALHIPELILDQLRREGLPSSRRLAIDYDLLATTEQRQHVHPIDVHGGRFAHQSQGNILIPCCLEEQIIVGLPHDPGTLLQILTKSTCGKDLQAQHQKKW